MVMLDKIAIEL